MHQTMGDSGSTHKVFARHFASQLAALPKHRLVCPTAVPLFTFAHTTPHFFEVASMDDVFASVCFSTYPIKNGTRHGDPIADRVYTQLYAAGTIAVISDGCGWGVRSMEAAANTERLVASRVFFREGMTIRDLGHVLVELFADIHLTNIRENKGSTTSAIVATAQIPDGFFGVVLSVGDCSTFLVRDAAVVRLSGEVRRDMEDISNSRGRLGGRVAPELDGSELRGFACDENDAILLMTDGMYDNFDPQCEGISPGQVGLRSWRSSDGARKKEEMLLKKLLMTYQMSSNYSVAPRPAHAQEFIEMLAGHCIQLTSKLRTFIQTSNARVPLDPLVMPGKTDHVSALIHSVGHMNRARLCRVTFRQEEMFDELLRSRERKRLVSLPHVVHVGQVFSPRGFEPFIQLSPAVAFCPANNSTPLEANVRRRKATFSPILQPPQPLSISTHHAVPSPRNHSLPSGYRASGRPFDEQRPARVLVPRIQTEILSTGSSPGQSAAQTPNPEAVQRCTSSVQ